MLMHRQILWLLLQVVVQRVASGSAQSAKIRTIIDDMLHFIQII